MRSLEYVRLPAFTNNQVDAAALYFENSTSVKLSELLFGGSKISYLILPKYLVLFPNSLFEIVTDLANRNINLAIFNKDFE